MHRLDDSEAALENSEGNSGAEPLLCRAADEIPAGGEILDDAAERLVDRHVAAAGAAGEGAGEHFPDLAEEMILADRALGEGGEQLRTLAQHALLVVGEEAGALDE